MGAEGLSNNAGVFRIETGEGGRDEACSFVLTFFFQNDFAITIMKQ